MEFHLPLVLLGGGIACLLLACSRIYVRIHLCNENLQAGQLSLSF